MAKTEMLIQGHVGTIGRRCIVCGQRWDAKHPNDPNTLFCPDCLYWLTKVIDKERGNNIHEQRSGI